MPGSIVHCAGPAAMQASTVAAMAAASKAPHQDVERSRTIAAALAVITRRKQHQQQQQPSREAEAWRERAQRAEASNLALLRSVLAATNGTLQGPEAQPGGGDDAAMLPAGEAAAAPAREAAVETLLLHAAHLLEGSSGTSTTSSRAVDFITGVLLRPDSPSSDLGRALCQTAVAALEAACASSALISPGGATAQQTQALIRQLLDHACQRPTPAPLAARARGVLQAMQRHPCLLQLQLLACAEACGEGAAQLLELSRQVQGRHHQRSRSPAGTSPQTGGATPLPAPAAVSVKAAAARMAALHGALGALAGVLLEGLPHLPRAVRAALDLEERHAAALAKDDAVAAQQQEAGGSQGPARNGVRRADHAEGAEGRAGGTLAPLGRAVEALAGALCTLQRGVAEGGGAGLACALPRAAVGRAVACAAVALQQAAQAERAAMMAVGAAAEQGGVEGALGGTRTPAEGSAGVEASVAWRHEACWRLCLRLREAVQPVVAFGPHD